MADVIRKATNRFTKGLIMDFSPENTKNEVLTHALNATLLTFNGNELSLQNDMGNARVETAYLPDGYMPVGTCEYGGIIYIVSYNPLEDKSQIGCFPSPERNISSKELGIEKAFVDREFFQKYENGIPDSEGQILHNTQYVLLKNDNLNPGDKFLVCADKLIYNEKLVDLWVDKDAKHYINSEDPKGYEIVSNPIIALNVVSIEESGKIIYLNSTLRQYEEPNTYNVEGESYTDIYKYHILGKMAENNGVYDLATVDPDQYRDVLNSGYSVFKSKTSGKLAILAELIMIDSYSVTYEIKPRTDDVGDIIEGTFDIIIHTDVTPEITINNYNTVPKLLYYYLENSLGYVLILEDNKSYNTNRLLFNITEENSKKIVSINDDFYKTTLSLIYESIDEDLKKKIQPENEEPPTLKKTGKFNFPRPFTYHGRMSEYTGNVTGTTNSSIYTKFTEGKYHRIDYKQITESDSYSKEELINYYKKEVLAKFFYYNEEGEEYQKYTEDVIDESYTYYIKKPKYTYYDAKRDENYKNDVLYKLITLPLTATEKEINDENIEKFQHQEIHTYKVATEADKDGTKKLYYTTDGGLTYTLLTGKVEEGVTYYILEIETNLVSIGFKVDYNVLTGTVYYYPTTKTYEVASDEDKEKYYDFETYPKTPEAPYGSPITLYRKETTEIFVEATENELNNYKELKIELYYSTNYILIPQIEYFNTEKGQLFIVVPMDTYITTDKFIPNTEYNYINGHDKPLPNNVYPKDDPIYLYTLSDFIPDNMDEEGNNYLKYSDVKLANIKLPSLVYLNGLDLPFKYDYTLVPCMNYGKLQHLAVSNTVDFSKLHAFNQSDFTTWKYYISENLLRLTFGADIYDTYEEYKVDGLVLEFYDCWGFAGSLEIVDKKSYSGIFTKIIPLNSLRALSKKKISGYEQTEVYKRNINIEETITENADGTKVSSFKFNDKSIGHDPITGWSIEEKEDNDCGTLYSNVLYGVKLYLRRPTKNGKEFIKKREFFLYTLPIYNDFYYTVNDFSNLTYPLLDLMLTYKLKDNSARTAYSQDGIVNGYNTEDKEKVSSYLGGFYDKTSLDITKYYKYSGYTDLYLEIGLKKEYENLNISYDPNINNYFTCTLRLLSDDEENASFTVNSGIDGLVKSSLILNYSSGNIPENINKLGFEGYTHTTTILSGENNFKEANFINYVGTKPIKINYQFIVGYTANIADIRNTLVQATTICALFHKKPNGEYNYEDFGVYELAVGEETKLLSNVMFYNEGTAEQEVFGICRQIALTGNILEQCLSITSVESDALEIKNAGKLNAGDPLKLLVGNIGKLTFCQPHAHGLSEINGVNIHEGENGYNYGIPPEITDRYIDSDFGSDTEYDLCYGINPRTFLYKRPKYNLCLNTKNSITYNSEFISTLDYKTITSEVRLDALEEGDRTWRSYTMREFTGFTGDEIATFNQKLILTMKSIYAYNPDYDSLTVNVGDITLQNYNPYFTSNLISTYSNLNFDEGITLNDFIYIGPVNFKIYLHNLNKYSSTMNENYEESKIPVEYVNDKGKIVFLPQVQLIPGYDYCGTLKSYYLISSLTYNTPVPRDLESELEFSSSDIIVIKHSNGDNTFLEGVPNKKTLYGYNHEFNKMILLDVSNYIIKDDGTLEIKSDGAKESSDEVLEITTEANQTIFDGMYNFTYDFTNEKGETVPLKLSLDLEIYSSMAESVKLSCGLDGFFIGTQCGEYTENFGFIMKPVIYLDSSNNKSNYNYSVKINSLEFEHNTRILNDKVSLMEYPIPLFRQSYDSLKKLISEESQQVTLIDAYGQNVYELNYNYWVQFGQFYNYIYANGLTYYSGFTNNVDVNDRGEININFEPILQMTNYVYVIGLMEFKLKKVHFTVTQTSKLETTPETFLTTTRTNKYSDKINSKYIIKNEYLKARLRGSSITINDLLYEPNVEGHRLFIRNNLCVYNSYLRGKLYYRFLNGGDDNSHDSWNYNNTKYRNNIFMFTGPCFTSDNLNYNQTIDG